MIKAGALATPVFSRPQSEPRNSAMLGVSLPRPTPPTSPPPERPMSPSLADVVDDGPSRHGSSRAVRLGS